MGPRFSATLDKIEDTPRCALARRRSIATQTIKIGGSLLALVVLLSAQCSDDAPSGGVVIAQNDSTAPTLTLSAGQPGGQDVAVSNAGSGQNTKLTSKSGP